MKDKKILITILIIIIAIISIVVLIVNDKNNLKCSKEISKYKKEDYIYKIKPISKENAIKILKAEYGDFITISENAIKQVGEEYVVDVLFGEKEEHSHEEDEHTSLGIHKINIYTGELIFPN